MEATNSASPKVKKHSHKLIPIWTLIYIMRSSQLKHNQKYGTRWLTLCKLQSKSYYEMYRRIRPRSHGTGSVWSPHQFGKSQDEHDS